MLLTSDIRDAVIDVLLLNIYSERNVGYASGKSGLALTLLNVAHRLGPQYEYLENHALSLLEEVLAMDIDLPTFTNGNAGIGMVLDSVISNGLIDADYSELFAKQTADVISVIKVLKYDANTSAECLDYLFFINAMRNRISDDDISACNDTLAPIIASHLENYGSRLTPWIIRNKYYIFAIRLMAAINALQSYESECTEHFFDLIRKDAVRLQEYDYVCQYPIYYFYLYLTDRHIRRNGPDESISQMFHESLKNIFTETMSFRELIDAVYLLLRINAFSESGGVLPDTVNKILSVFTDDGKTLFESKLKQILYRSAGCNIGISGGLSRLLMLDCFWDDMKSGHFPKNVTLLFF